MSLSTSLRNRTARRRLAGERGASVVEYTLLLCFLALVSLFALQQLGAEADVPLQRTGAAISTAQP